jgi:Zn-dependent M28 family amino/carboxypeptidase
MPTADQPAPEHRALDVGEPIDGDPIYHGAMDDTAGAATLLEIANRIQGKKIQTTRSPLLVAITGPKRCC